LSANATIEETRTALYKMEKNVFDTAKALNHMNQGMRSKKGMVVSHQLTEIDNEYNRQKYGISCKYSSTAIKELDKLVTIPPDDTRTLSIRYSLSFKVNKGWLPKEFGSIPSNSLKLKLLSDCCIANAHTARFQIYMIVSPDPQENKIIVLFLCDYVPEDKPNQDMIDTL